MVRKAVPLAVELVLTLAGLVLVTTIALTIAAYRSVHADLDNDARQLVRGSADQMAKTLQRVVEQHQQLGRGFLSSVTALCGEPTPRGGIAWELTCVNRAIAEFWATDRAIGVVFEYRERQIAQAGAPLQGNLRAPDGFARLVSRPSALGYVITATFGDSALTELFSIDELDLLVSNHAVLGARGEIVLVDPQGHFLTTPRYGGRSTPPAATDVEPIAECLQGPSEIIGLDYRGVTTIHGLRPISVFLGGACLDAHLPYDEAVAPAGTLLAQLSLRGAVLTIIGILLSLVAAHWIAAPVRRLAHSARALENGDFDRPIPIGGPSEVRALGRGFLNMAHAIRDLVAREQEARHEAEAANRAKDEFLATVSHELRSPLTSILGWAQLFRFAKLEGDVASRAIGAIERAAETQSRLVEDLLDVSRIVAGRLEIARLPVSLPGATEAAIEGVRPDIAAKGITLNTTIELVVPPVLGDSHRLQQIVSNLLTNAIKFTPADGRITVSVRHVNDVVELSVADTGVGIATDFLPHVFERFRQAGGTAPHAAGGLGLGLAIVQHLVKLHGGDVMVTSDGPDQGATFTVTLPAYQGSVATTVEAPSAATFHAQRLERVRVLLIDDDLETLRVVRAILENAGARVETAVSASEARAAVSAWHPSVVVSDIAMPHEDGNTFMRSLRASDSHLPAIALTALGRRADAVEAHAAGFQLYIQKPVKPEKLVNAVASLVETGNVH